MYTMLASAKAPEEFNADYYIAIVTILPILVVAIEVLANFAKSIPLEVERNLSHPIFWLVSFYYNFTPLLSALGIVMGLVALILRYTNAIYQWATFILLVNVLFFVAIASYVYLRAVDGERQRGGAADGERQTGGAAQVGEPAP